MRKKIKEVIVVEGKYDKIKLSQLVDTSIFCSDGFQIYRNSEMISLLKRLAKSNGVILFTDSDSAGFRIRNFIKNKLSGCNVKHAYLPDIYGKESRKERPSKEGKLGVEGVPDDVILRALSVCGATFLDEGIGSVQREAEHFQKIDLYRAGLCGKEESRSRREQFLRRLSLPVHMSSSMLLGVLNTMYRAGLVGDDLSEYLEENEQ